MYVTLLGIDTDTTQLQLLKIDDAMLVNVDGRSTAVRFLL